LACSSGGTEATVVHPSHHSVIAHVPRASSAAGSPSHQHSVERSSRRTLAGGKSRSSREACHSRQRVTTLIANVFSILLWGGPNSITAMPMNLEQVCDQLQDWVLVPVGNHSKRLVIHQLQRLARSQGIEGRRGFVRSMLDLVPSCRVRRRSRRDRPCPRRHSAALRVPSLSHRSGSESGTWAPAAVATHWTRRAAPTSEHLSEGSSHATGRSNNGTLQFACES
jgi:hypothetical protein